MYIFLKFKQALFVPEEICSTPYFSNKSMFFRREQIPSIMRPVMNPKRSPDWLIPVTNKGKSPPTFRGSKMQNSTLDHISTRDIGMEKTSAKKQKMQFIYPFLNNYLQMTFHLDRFQLDSYVLLRLQFLQTQHLLKLRMQYRKFSIQRDYDNNETLCNSC